MTDTCYPATPGHRGVSTSIEAAERVGSASGRLRQIVLKTLHAHPAGMTVDEVCAVANLPRYSLQPRFSELKRLGRIYDTGERRESIAGARMIVWAVSALREPPAATANDNSANRRPDAA